MTTPYATTGKTPAAANRKTGIVPPSAPFFDITRKIYYKNTKKR
jgi:hypothetical protein